MNTGSATSRQRRFISLTNIPTPYRLHFYKILSQELERRNWSFEVWFMARTESHHPWTFAETDFCFPHRFLRGFRPTLKQVTLHLNPRAVVNLWRDPPQVLMVGSWILPTIILVLLALRRTKGCRVLGWVESHQRSARYENRMLKHMRHSFCSRCDGFATPGVFARQYVQSLSPGKPVYSLPNVIDDGTFSAKVQELRQRKEALRAALDIPAARRVLLLPARLAPEKAVGPFLECLSSLPTEVLQRCTLLVAGDGPLRGPISQWLSHYPNLDVRLLGNVPAEDMPRLYAAGDALVLPSLRDPNPLSVIEACWARMPLLLSDRIGNHPEALRPAENGWLFDPQDPGAVVRAIEQFLSAPEAVLDRMGGISQDIAETNFHSETVVKQFLDQAGVG